jgi:outer membrane protein assembly factor BamD
MIRSVTALAAALLALTLGGCGLFTDKTEPKSEWGAADYYKSAKEEFDSGNWESAIKRFEALEAKFPYGRFAQQAQLEVAYAYYKQGESAQAISAIDKFTKLHPNHEHLDYALYLRALVNFKEDLGPPHPHRQPGPRRPRPEGGARVLRGLQGRGDALPAERLRRGFARAHGLPGRGARPPRGEGGALLPQPRRPACRRQPRAGRAHPLPQLAHPARSLEIMIEAYDRMGMAEMRDDTRKVLAKNFPADRMAKEGQNRSKPWYQFWGK